MSELFLDIRDRNIRAVATDNGVVRFQKAYPLQLAESSRHTGQEEQSTGHAGLIEGELASVLSLIRSDAGISLDQAHLIVPFEDVTFTPHILPRMPQQEALKLLTRKTATGPDDESPQINLVPMSVDQNNQTWLTEFITTDTLKSYKKELRTARFTLKTVTTSLDAILHAATSIRESIFNAHAVFEINTHSIEAYYISASCLLYHEYQDINDSRDYNSGLDAERNQKRRMFNILDQLHRINSQFQNSNPMNPLQKVWICGTDSSIPELVSALQDAMDVDTALLSDGQSDDQITDCQFTALKGMQKAFKDGVVFNFMHPDLVRRFPLRKKYGMLIYVATAILATSVVISTEYRQVQLKKQAVNAKKNLAAQKQSQAATASFTKNLDMLKRLSGSQVMFYPIFKELATNLPDGVYLDSFSFQNKDNRSILEVSATFSHSSDLGTKRTLTRLMDVFDRSSYLHHHREPSIISSTKDQMKIMTVKFFCEVNPLDTAK